jgi:hypothetical protein
VFANCYEYHSITWNFQQNSDKCSPLQSLPGKWLKKGIDRPTVPELTCDGCFHNKFLVPLGSICYQLELEVDGVLEGGICMP